MIRDHNKFTGVKGWTVAEKRANKIIVYWYHPSHGKELIFEEEQLFGQPQVTVYERSLDRPINRGNTSVVAPAK